MKISKTEFWDSEYYINIPLTNEMVLIAEKELNVKLPSLLIELLQIQNGGYTKGFGFPMTQPTSWADNHVPLSELNGIVIKSTSETIHNLLQTPYMTKEWGIPEKQVLLSGDGHYWITLDYRKGINPSVRWIDTEMDQDIHVADNFEEFFNGLVSFDTFETE
jgi:SMI1-KNR4 cell-wall